MHLSRLLLSSSSFFLPLLFLLLSFSKQPFLYTTPIFTITHSHTFGRKRFCIVPPLLSPIAYDKALSGFFSPLNGSEYLASLVTHPQEPSCHSAFFSRNVAYGRGSNLLDIYIGTTPSSPPALDHSDDDNDSEHTVESNGSPVIIYVYGGAWDAGHKSMMMPMAQNLANQGYIVVVPDYTRYPRAKIEDMVSDVQDAVNWTGQTVTRYGGDPSNIFLMGSGSGAHVASLAIMHDAVEQLGCVPVPAVEGDTTPLVKIPSWPELPTDMGRKVGSQRFKERVQGLILFSGVFDITFYYAYLHKRGIEEVSAMPRVMHQSASNYLACSPSWLLASATAALENTELLEQVLPNSILIIHGEQVLFFNYYYYYNIIICVVLVKSVREHILTDSLSILLGSVDSCPLFADTVQLTVHGRDPQHQVQGVHRTEPSGSSHRSGSAFEPNYSGPVERYLGCCAAHTRHRSKHT